MNIFDGKYSITRIVYTRINPLTCKQSYRKLPAGRKIYVLKALIAFARRILQSGLIILGMLNSGITFNPRKISMVAWKPQ